MASLYNTPQFQDNHTQDLKKPPHSILYTPTKNHHTKVENHYYQPDFLTQDELNQNGTLKPLLSQSRVIENSICSIVRGTAHWKCSNCTTQREKTGKNPNTISTNYLASSHPHHPPKSLPN